MFEIKEIKKNETFCLICQKSFAREQSFKMHIKQFIKALKNFIVKFVKSHLDKREVCLDISK